MLPGRLALAALLLLAASAAGAQERTVRVVSGFAAGGASDFVSRVVAEAVGPMLGARAVVENRTGANGAIGAAEVARSAPDGGTVFQCPMSTLAIAPQLIGASLPVDPGTALQPIATVALSSYGFVVAADGPYRSVEDVLEAARRRPGQVTFASAGVGSAQHLSGELLQQKTGLRMTHVPYRGATPAIVDILGGRTDFMITNLGDATRHIQGGKLRLLAIADGPSRRVAEVPAAARRRPGLVSFGSAGICGPKGLSGEPLRRWEEALRAALRDEAVVRRLADNGLTPHFEDAATLARRLENDRRTWLEVIRAVNVRAE